MKKAIFLIIFALLCGIVFLTCGGSENNRANSVVKNDNAITELEITPVKLEPLKDEVLKLKGKDIFSKVIELKGEQVIVESLIIKPSEVEMVIKDNFMLFKSRGSSVGNIGMFTLLRLPDLQLIKSFGNRGQGPDDFMYPVLCRNTDPNIIATVVEITRGEIYDVLANGALIKNNIRLPNSNTILSSRLYPSLLTDKQLYYAANSSTGKSVFTFGGIDSLQIKEIQNLALDPKRKGWANYIGDFAINTEQSRLVYAYKFFKIVSFFDLENHTIRTINFEREEYDESTQYIANGLDANLTHYWGICASEKYVYMLYSGRTPVQVYTDNNKGNHYIFVEKYDWNGQPIAKYKLDQWGYFTVDEKNSILYLVSTNHDDPFFKYQL